MKAMNTTGKTKALITVVTDGRTRVIRRFLTVNVQICRRKSLIVAECKKGQTTSSSFSIPTVSRTSGPQATREQTDKFQGDGWLEVEMHL